MCGVEWSGVVCGLDAAPFSSTSENLRKKYSGSLRTISDLKYCYKYYCTVYSFMITLFSQSVTYSLTPSLFLSVCGRLHLSPFPHCTAWLLCRQQNSSVELFPGYMCVYECVCVCVLVGGWWGVGSGWMLRRIRQPCSNKD